MLPFSAKFCKVQVFTLLPVSRWDAGAAQAPRMAPGILEEPLPDLSPQARGPTASASCRAPRCQRPDAALPAQALVAAHYREASEARKRLPPPSDAAVRCAGLFGR